MKAEISLTHSVRGIHQYPFNSLSFVIYVALPILSIQSIQGMGVLVCLSDKVHVSVVSAKVNLASWFFHQYAGWG